jgi:hypothetical protein
MTGSSDDDRPIIVSAPPGEHVFPGTQLLPCEFCGIEVTVAPSSMTMVVEGAHVQCIPCVVARGELKGTQFSFAPGELAELELMGIKPDEAKAAAARMNAALRRPPRAPGKR